MFYFDENVMNDIMSLLNKNTYQVENMENGYLNKMSSISNSGLYGNGIETIDSQITAVKDGFTNFKNITSNNCNKVLNLEQRLIEEAGDIPLPKNWDANDTGYSTDIKTVTLDKEDGRAVVEGVASTEQTMTDYYGDQMTNIEKLKNTELHEDELQDYVKAKTVEGLEDITSEETQEQQMEDIKETKRSNLDFINSETDNTTREYDDNYVNVNRETQFEDISKDELDDDDEIKLDDIDIG